MAQRLHLLALLAICCGVSAVLGQNGPTQWQYGIYAEDPKDEVPYSWQTANSGIQAKKRSAVFQKLGGAPNAAAGDDEFVLVTLFELLGKDGWELVQAHTVSGATKTRYFFRRPLSKFYSPEQIARTDAEVLFSRLADADPARDRFAAMRALVQKAMTGGQEVIVRRGMEIVKDGKRPLLQRWQTCYVLSMIKDPQAIPVLAWALLEEKDATLNGVAACALGAFDSPTATEALTKALAVHNEDEQVLKWVRKAQDDAVRRRPPMLGTGEIDF
jgi:hypothetical protein